MKLLEAGIFMGGLGILVFAGVEAYALIHLRKELNSLET